MKRVVFASLLLVACNRGPNWQRFSDAVQSGDIVAADVELSKTFDGASFNRSWSNTGVSPLHIACAAGQTDLVRQLLDKGVDANLPDAQGETPLTGASGNGHPETVKLLLDKGAALNVTAPDGKTKYSPALFSAVSRHQPKITEMLLAAGASTQRAPSSPGVFFSAAVNDDELTLQQLLDKRPEFPDLTSAEWQQIQQRQPALAAALLPRLCDRLKSNAAIPQGSDRKQLLSFYQCLAK